MTIGALFSPRRKSINELKESTHTETQARPRKRKMLLWKNGLWITPWECNRPGMTPDAVKNKLN
jgi:hypothetical protein